MHCVGQQFPGAADTVLNVTIKHLTFGSRKCAQQCNAITEVPSFGLFDRQPKQHFRYWVDSSQKILQLRQKCHAVTIIGVDKNDNGIDSWRLSKASKQLGQPIEKNPVRRIALALQPRWNSTNTFVGMNFPSVCLALLSNYSWKQEI